MRAAPEGPRSESGQGLVEYALLVGLALIAVMAAVLTLDPGLTALFDHAANCLANLGAC